MANKLALSIIISVILTVILVSTVNVGISLFLEEPNYQDYCPDVGPKIIENQTACDLSGGEWKESYCDYYSSCSKEWEEALKPYNQIKFYILALIGFTLLLTGLFHKENLIQLTGLATGGILVFEGIVTNLQNKSVVFISLLLILIIFGILAQRVIKKK